MEYETLYPRAQRYMFNVAEEEVAKVKVRRMEDFDERTLLTLEIQSSKQASGLPCRWTECYTSR